MRSLNLTSRRWALQALLTAVASTSAVLPALAQDAAFPNRPVKIIVPYPAGGVVDVTTRAVTEALSQQWGQPVIVENRAGANGNLGAEAVRQAKPDGYTLLVGSMFTVINPLTDANTRFKTADFQPVAAIGFTPNLWVVPASSKFHSLQELVAQARKRPGALNVANPGLGSSNHLGIDRLTAEAAIDLTHINYQGQPPFITDLINARLDVAPVTAALALPHVQSGALRVLAVIAEERLQALPDVPTVAEAGWPGAVVVPWNGIMAPAGTPAAIVKAVGEAVARVQQSPQVLSRYAALQAQAPAQAQAFPQLVVRESQRWAAVLGAQLQVAAKGGKELLKN